MAPAPAATNAGKPSTTVTVSDLLKTGLQHLQSGRFAEAEACYRHILAAQPNHADALHLLGLTAHHLKRYDEAVTLINQAIAQNGPLTTVYLTNLGGALVEQGKFEKAIECYDKAIALKPDQAETYKNRAGALAKLQRLDEAIASYDKALSITPDDLKILEAKGVLLGQSGRHEEALACYDKILALKPDHAGAYNNRAIALDHLQQYDEAFASYDRALALNPDDVAVLNNRGNTLRKLGRLDEALICHDKALAINPTHVEAYNNRGIVLRELKRFDEAITNFKKALEIKPDHVEAMDGLGTVLMALERREEALACYDRVLTLRPNQAEALINRGTVLCTLNKYDEALQSVNKALALEPRDPMALNNLGLALNQFKRFDEALACFEKAISINPNLAVAHWNESLFRLLGSDFERGWQKYEWRWKAQILTSASREFSQPAWLGQESIEGKRILIYNEQGLGDAIQFCRYIPLLAAQGAHVIVEIADPLRPLLSGLAGVAQCVSTTEKLPDFDFQCSVNSLPLAFKTRLETIPATTPYLHPPAQTQEWDAKLGPKNRPRIGLVWSGNPNHGNDRNRSANLRALLPLFDIDATFVNLQKDVRPEDQNLLNERNDILNLGPTFQSFADTAAVISNLDLVISVDTSVAHLAGAMGKPVWILLPFIPEWRWLIDREDSPWYPTARLFRQDDSRAWPSVIERVRDALENFIANERAVGAKTATRGPQSTLKSNPGRSTKPIQRNDPSVPVLVSTPTSTPVPASTPDELMHRGSALFKEGKYEEALACYDKLIALKPEDANAHTIRGNILDALKKYDEALASFDQAITLRPDFVIAHNERGNLLRKLNRLEEALASYDKALSLMRDNEGLLYNRGIVLLPLERPQEALAYFDRALSRKPQFTEALNARGLALRDLRRFDEALACFEKVIAIDPNHANAHWNESRLRRLLGDFERGWAKAEWRWKASGPNLTPRNFKEPLWLGIEPVKDKRILLHSDEGQGDAIQFCRYAPLLAAQGAHVIIEVQKPLQPLLATLPGITQCLARGEKLPSFDLHCPLNTLPVAFKTRLETIPAAISYLHPPAQAAEWEKRLGRNDRPRIGLAWSSEPGNGNDRAHSTKLEALLSLLDTNATFISLQKDVRPKDQALLNERKDIIHLGPSLKDFADTAAVVSKLDLVISVDTSVAHLAGALGKPVWILLPLIPDWRWMLDREDSPWYPTARLFRQDESRKWDGVIERVQKALDEFVSNHVPVRIEIAPPAKHSAINSRGGEITQMIARNNGKDTVKISAGPENQPSSVPAAKAIADLLKAGITHHQSNRLSEAEDCYQRVLATEPENANALHLLGLVFHQTKRFDAAIDFINRAIAKNGPGTPTYLTNLGVVWASCGKYEQALECYEKALALKPDYVEAHQNSAIVLNQLNRFEEALTIYDRLLELRPEDAKIWSDRATTLTKLRKHNKALESADKALTLRSDSIEAMHSRSIALRELGRFQEALACCEKMLALKPDYADAYNTQGTVLNRLHRYEDAIASYDRALSLNPSNAAAFNNKGNALQTLGRFEEAISCYDKALALNPNFGQALSNRGAILVELKRFNDALANLEQAILIDSDDAQAHWNESLIRLTLGDFERGWAKYEWRWKAPGLNSQSRNYAQPYWLGNEPLKGKRILIYNEQGLGDAIQFCRYVPMLAAQGADVIMGSDESLRPLMEKLPGLSQCVLVGEPLPHFDFHSSINSLPLAFKTRLETIPAAVPYLHPPAQMQEWEARLGRKDRPRIGLVWSGRPTHTNDRNRSASLYALLPLLDADATFISLQKDVRPNDQALLNERKDILDLGSSFKNFAETAAVISKLDLVISVDTSVAHLAGALGKPVWILLPYASDWRWLIDREDSPWYPTARLFRQDESRKWESVVERVRKALDEFFELKTPRGPKGPHGSQNKSNAIVGDVTNKIIRGKVKRKLQLEHKPLISAPITAISGLQKKGIEHHRSGRIAEAKACYERVLAAEPSHPDALHLLGVIAYQSKRHDEAVHLIHRAIARNANNPAYFSNLALALHEQGKYEQALANYDKALALKPDYVEAHNNRAVTLVKLKRFTDALANYDRALALKPDYVDAMFGRGTALRHLEQYEEALATYDKALALKPDHAESHNGRGIVLELLKRHEEALTSSERALAVAPHYPAAFINRGNALRSLNRFDEAIANYDAALSLDPHNTTALSNRGLMLTEVKRFDEALASYQKAISIEPDHSSAHWNEALTRLLLGDFERAWAKAEWRWKVSNLKLRRPDVSQPAWLGESSVQGKRILIYNEQGFGDTIQFCRYVPLLAAQGAHVIVQAQRPLLTLMSELSGASQCVVKGETLPDFDVHCSVNSLPLVFKTRLETIPATIPYLRPPAQITEWDAKLGRKDRPRIGLVWSGRRTHANDHNRSMALKAFLPLLDAIDATFVSLQKEVRPEYQSLLNERKDILNLGPSFENFADTAAVIANLDLIISVDTSVAHLAGALGKPVWILLPYVPDWRWLLDRDDSPWYPTARLFRQDESRAWPSVIERVRKALGEFVAQKKALQST